MVACLYAMGFRADEMYQIFKKYCNKIKYVDIFNIFKLIIGLIFTGRIVIDGLNSGSQIEKLINKVAKTKGIKDIEDIQKNLVIPSVNLCNGKVICFTSCKTQKTFLENTKWIKNVNIGKAVRASCSYPVIFSPCHYQNTRLIDGGIRENVPWKELKAIGAKKVINIMFNQEEENNCDKNIIEVAGRSIDLLCKELSNYEMERAEHIIKIKSNKVGLLDMKKIDELYEAGYQQTKKYVTKGASPFVT